MVLAGLNDVVLPHARAVLAGAPGVTNVQLQVEALHVDSFCSLWEALQPAAAARSLQLILKGLEFAEVYDDQDDLFLPTVRCNVAWQSATEHCGVYVFCLPLHVVLGGRRLTQSVEHPTDEQIPKMMLLLLYPGI